MYPIDLEVLNLAQAEHRYYIEFPVRIFRDQVMHDVLAMSSTASITLRHRYGYLTHRNTIFIALREDLLPEVPTLALNDFSDCRNDFSPDLLHKTTYVIVNGEHVQLRILEWPLIDFMNGRSSDGCVFDVVYVCGPLVFVSTHRPSAADVDSISCDSLGCGDSSGQNYRPYAVWSDEEIAEAARKTHKPLHGLITATAIDLPANWRANMGFPSYE